MCEMCDGMTLEEHLRKVQRTIDERGWYLMVVEGSGAVPTWSYSVGLSDGFDHPEFVVVGVEDGPLMVDAFAQSVSDGEPSYEVGQVIDFGDRSIRIGAVHRTNRKSLFNGWDRYHRFLGQPDPVLEVVQLLPSDESFCACHRGSQIDLSRPLPTRRTNGGGAHRRRNHRRRS